MLAGRTFISENCTTFDLLLFSIAHDVVDLWFSSTTLLRYYVPLYFHEAGIHHS